jgi:hypothetical protein
MAPKTSAIRLSAIDPQTVALDTARTLLDHVTTLLWQVAPIGDVPTPGIEVDALTRSQIYQCVRTLAHYAVHGGELDAPVHEYLVSLIPLYTSAIGEGTSDVDGLVESEPETELGVVIAAAVAREQLAAGKAITPAQLAVLAGVNRDYLLQLAAAGDLPGARQAKEGKRAWTVTAKGALQWLESRA